MSNEQARTRQVTWQDPMIGAEAAKTMSGLDYIKALIDGSIPEPPIVRLMNMNAVSAEVGKVTFTCDPDESMYNPIGVIHGGLVCTLLDSVLGCATQTTLPLGQGYTSLDITVSYLRAVTKDSGQLTAVGRMVRPGTRAAFAEATVHDASGKLVATATSTLLVFPVG